MHIRLRSADCGALLFVLLTLAESTAWAGIPVSESVRAAEKALIVDGSGVLNAGRINVNITNWGLIGSQFSTYTTYSDAPSVQWPGGSGMEYVFAAGLWIGGSRNGVVSVSTGQYETEILPGPEPENVLYEAWETVLVAPVHGGVPTGVPGDLPEGDDDGDGRVDEDPLDGFDNDGDGRVDEDFAQLGSQMLTCLMRDDTRLAGQMFPNHRPLNVEVRFSACAWNTSAEQDLIGLRWVIRNVGLSPIEDLYIGFLVDGDIGRHDDGAAGEDDLAGNFSGLVRQPEGSFADLEYAWMRDGDPVDTLPGWLGVTFEGSGFGDPGAVRPEAFGLNAMRILNVAQGLGYGSMPLLDEDRYEVLARSHHDPDVPPNRLGDYVVLLSVGPWKILRSGEYVVVNGTLTVAPGAEALRDAMLANQQTAWGRWYNADGVASTGAAGRESMVCAEDFGIPWDGPENLIYRHTLNYWNPECRPAGLLDTPITSKSLVYYPKLKKHCIWVSRDNCEECRRFNGVDCTSETGYRNPCSSNTPAARLACTGMSGREANIPFSSDILPPPLPGFRVAPHDRAIEIYWDDSNERVLDSLTGLDDFEAYRIWRADNWERPPGSSERTGPPPNAWHMIAEFDRVNYLVPFEGQPLRSFGRNTGFDQVAYQPVCLEDERFAGLAQAMQDIVWADVTGSYAVRPPLRDRFGQPNPGLEALLRWETCPEVLDTFFAVTERPDSVGVPKPAVGYYRFWDEDLFNGYLYFYSVTAVDHVPSPDGAGVLTEGIGSRPSGHFVAARPRFEAVSAEQPPDQRPRPFVYPNPATRAALAEFQKMYPARDDPSGVRVSFANLPRCRCTIHVCTLAGDLVKTIEHDGALGDGQAYWNLVSRSGQKVASGIYIFTVTPHDGRYEKQAGKFVVVR